MTERTCNRISRISRVNYERMGFFIDYWESGIIYSGQNDDSKEHEPVDMYNRKRIPAHNPSGKMYQDTGKNTQVVTFIQSRINSSSN